MSIRRLGKLAAAVALFFVALLLCDGAAFAHTKKPKPDATSTLMDDYLKRARSANQAAPATPGSLWVPNGAIATLAMDYRAINAGDLIVIHLADNFTAATAGENSQTRAFTAQSGITGLVGNIGTRNRLQNLFGGNSNSSLDGKGSSTLSSNVTLNLAAQVLEVLPNGVLVVQAARDITVGNDRQTVILRGLVRPGDLAVDNSVLSSSVGNLEVEIKGKGAVADATRQPNIIVRTILKILTF
ncbi:MAG: flagellar basal body L-ring protein FlgH [Candidatus Acidiferrum sp.]